MGQSCSAIETASSRSTQNDINNKELPHSKATMNAVRLKKEMMEIGPHKLEEVGFSRAQSEAAIQMFDNYQDALDALLRSRVTNAMSTECDGVRSAQSKGACSSVAPDIYGNVPSNTVRVSGVCSWLSEQELRDIFSICGKVIDVCIVHPWCHTYVTYSDTAESSKAVKMLDSVSYKDCKFGVRFSSFVPTPKQLPDEKDKKEILNTGDSKIPDHKIVCVSNVLPCIQNTEMEELFSNAGTIKSISFQGEKKRAYIEYNSSEEARAAVTRLSGFRFKGAVFSVETVAFVPPDDPKQSTGSVETKWTTETKPPHPEPTYNFKRIWVGGLLPDVKDLELLNIFSEYGTIVNYCFLREKMCAFISYESEDATRKTMDTLQGHEVHGRKIRISYAFNSDNKGKRNTTATSAASQSKGESNSSSSNETSNTLWVGNVVPQITDLDLIQLFCRHAELKNCRIVRKRKCAFFHYHCEADATKTLQRLQGYVFLGHKLILNYASGYKREDGSGPEYCTKRGARPKKR